MVARPLLLHAKLPATLWRHAILHAATLLRLCPTLLNPITSQELLTGRTPNVSHLRVFGCRVWVPRPEPLRRTIAAHREEGVYMGFDSPSILRYFVPSSRALLKARFQNCIFEENVFPYVPCPKGTPDLNFYSPQTFTLNPDPRTLLSETEVQKILHLQALADRLPNGFSDAPRVTRIPVPRTGFKCKISALHTDVVLQTTENAEEKPDPLTLEEVQRSDEWPQWETALQAEYNSLKKHKVFGEYSHTLTTRLVGHKLIFTKKRNAQGRVLRFKVRLVAQGFNQRPGIDFDSTYSPVMDAGTFRYLLGFSVQFSLQALMLDVMTAYLHGPLETQLFLKPPPSFSKVPLPPPRPGQFSGLRLYKALYGLRQAGRLWYQHLRDFLLDQNLTNDTTLLCVFAHKTGADFVILAVYVDDINLIGTKSACQYAIQRLESRFDIKFLGKTSLCLGLQISHFLDGAMLLHQTAYTRRILKRFGMHHANSLAAPMIGKSRTL